MTKKHFELIAQALRANRPYISAEERALPINQTEVCKAIITQWEVTCINMAFDFSAKFPRFDVSRFLTACGVESSAYQEPKQLRCDMDKGCAAPVTHVDGKGFIYCADHGHTRKNYCRCRKLSRAEFNALSSGQTISY